MQETSFAECIVLRLTYVVNFLKF
uniref:Uncharacterized protein n=1 Tax=Arundo donax TaxID=35708 RepID=A0A0A9BUZ3_ARUDO